VLTLLVYGSRSDYGPQIDSTLSIVLAAIKSIAAMVFLGPWDIATAAPVLMHLSKHDNVEKHGDMSLYSYPEASSASFIVPGHPDFRASSAGVAHTRTLSFLKKHMGGPFFDLEKIWEEHAFYEFGDRSVEKTMGTMVQEPYVNHVPTVCPWN
jgi:carboxymethylenebutenolidase